MLFTTIQEKLQAISNNIKLELIAPVLPNSRVLTTALGKFATIPAVIINEIPLPTPLDVICSPNHIKKTVPLVSVKTVVNLKKIPGSITTGPDEFCKASKPTATPYP